MNQTTRKGKHSYLILKHYFYGHHKQNLEPNHSYILINYL